MVAVFMAAFLVGGLWYIIGLGDAAIYRQYMQDGADAIAFGSAVYHARGMNIIALINCVMAAVLMVLVAFKIAQLLLIAANIASCLLGAWLDPVCDLTTAAEEPFETWVSNVEKLVDAILKILYQTSNAVAIGMPWVAEGKAIVVAGEYKPTVHGGLMASISLIPGPIESAMGGFVTRKSGAKGGTTSSSTGARPRWGLPVQDDDYAVLCDHAGRYVVSFVFLPLDFLGMGGLGKGVEKFAGGMVGGLVKSFPGYFCGGMTDAGKGLVDSIKTATLGKASDSLKDACDKKAKDAKKKKEKFDVGKCLDSGKGLDKLGKVSGSTLGKDKTSKKVYGAATLGDDYFAIWSFDWGNLREQSDAAKGVDVAGWNKAHANDPTILSRVGVAQAEFYYEPKPGDPKKWRKDLSDSVPFGLGGTKEGGLEEEAMWNMRWRARLRRVRLPYPSVGGILADKITDKIKVPIIGDLLKWPAGKVGEIVDSKIKEVVGPVTDELIVH